MKFISDNIPMTQKMRGRSRNQGKVICRFVVEKDGRFTITIFWKETASTLLWTRKRFVSLVLSRNGIQELWVKKQYEPVSPFPSFSVCGERKYRSDILYPRTVKVAIFMTNPNGLIVYYRFFNNETYYLGIVVSSGFSCNRKGFLP